MSEATSLRAVMFWPGHYTHLFRGGKYDIYGQLDGVLELLEICDSYVLNDTTALGGQSSFMPRPDDPFAKFIASEARRGAAIQTIGGSASDDIDPAHAQAALGVAAAATAAEEEYENSGHSDTWRQLSDTANILQAQSYILLADELNAMYIPERLYGYAALAKYNELLKRGSHVVHETVRTHLMAKFAQYSRDRSPMEVHVPCFLVEALQASTSAEGFPKALRDLRDSRAARTYRELARIMAARTSSLKEWNEAREALESLANAAFTREGLNTQVPTWLKVTAGFTSAGVAILFPEAIVAAAAAALLPSAVEALDSVDTWIRGRANLFKSYANSGEPDLYAALKGVFPKLSFGAPQLEHFLRTRNFGWSNHQELLRSLQALDRD